jgi:hypothetical protein
MKLLKLLSGQGTLLGAGGLILAASAIAGSGTLAGFQATTSNNSNVFNAGFLRMANVAGTAISGTDCAVGATAGVLSGTCATVFNATPKVPGDSSANTVAITNTGNVDGLLSVSVGTITTGSNASSPAPSCSAANQTTFKGQVGLTIDDGTTPVSGTLAAPPSFSARSLTAGASKTYTVTLTFNSTGSTAGDNNLQNCAASFPISWTLDQRAATSTVNGQ